jgi:hypothetical protein
VKAAVDRPSDPHPIEAERANGAVSSADPNRVECRDRLGRRCGTLEGNGFNVGGLNLPPSLQICCRWTGVRMGTAHEHTLDIHAGRIGSLRRNGSGQVPAESDQVEAEQQHALACVILQNERTREQIVMNLGGAPLEIDAVPGQLGAERWCNGDLGNSSTSHVCGITPFADRALAPVSP